VKNQTGLFDWRALLIRACMSVCVAMQLHVQRVRFNVRRAVCVFRPPTSVTSTTTVETTPMNRTRVVRNTSNYLSLSLSLFLPRSVLMLVGVSKWLKPQAGNCENIRAACPRITSLTDGQLVHGPGITLLNSGLTCIRPLTLRNVEMSNRSNKHFKQCNVCSGRPARFTVNGQSGRRFAVISVV